MYLTLEVLGANGAKLGENRRKVMGPEGGLIGRGRENEWVIDDPHVSRQHARLRCVNGTFFVEGLGKNPIALNSPDRFMPNNQPQMLREGDRFYIDRYEVLASIASQIGAPSAPAPAAPRPVSRASALLIPGNPFAEPASAPTEPGRVLPLSAASGLQGWDARIPSATDDAMLDPLAILDGSPAPAQADLPPVNWQQSSPLSDSYRPPDVPGPAPSAAPPAPSAPGVIPDQWDMSRITQVNKPAALAPASTRQSPPQPPRPKPSAAAQPMQPPPAQPMQPPAARSVPPPPAQTARPKASPDPAAAGAGSVTPATAKGSIDLDEMLRAAGVSSERLSPETARELGEVLRIVFEGVMEVLRARAEIKSQFRMPVTRVQASENNPLKFSPNVEAALHTLLADRNRGYMPAPRAFEDAFEDIRSHQLAVLEGIRSAFKAMLARFEPEKLQADFERQAGGRAGLLNLGGKSRLWDQYAEHFRSLTEDPDDSFRRLFGDEFAEAYEQQLERLKTARRNTRR